MHKHPGSTGSLTGVLLLAISAMVLAPCESGKAVWREGYDAKTGKWINRKPSPYAFSITPEVYQEVKNWYATDSGTNNPDHLPVMVPKAGYTYIYTPYKDPKHPYVTGMSLQGADGYKGYWYADDLTKATDSTDASGNDIQIPPPKDNTPANVKYGGYDARTGKWIDTAPSPDAFSVTQGTYTRVKNWFSTNYGANNPLNLQLEVPREGYSYIYVPYNDPKHPGIMGMSFQGDYAFKGYWYADKIPGLSDVADTASVNSPVQNAQQSMSSQQAPPPPVQSNSTPPDSAAHH